MDITNSLEYKNAPKKSLLFKTNRNDQTTTKNTLDDLRNAIHQAQSIDYPNRYQLLEVYKDIINDAHLSAVVKHRKSRVTGLQWSISKNTGKNDEAATMIFNQCWFKKFLDYTLDSLFWGNSLVEILNVNGKVEVNLIPRENVVPEFQQVKRVPYNMQGDIDYSAPIYSNSLIDMNNEYDTRNLGEYLAVAKLVLFKQEVMLNWSQYIELFGQPIRVATNDTEDPQEKDQIFRFLKDLGRSGYVVKNSNTELEFVDTNGNGKSELYNDFINVTNNEVSKKLLGGTMLTDDGSSKSQSEVHERGSLLFTKSDIVYIEHIINDKLIPLLLHNGILKTKSLEFNFDEPEILTIEEKLKVDEFLVANFEIKDITYFEKRYGVGLKHKKTVEQETIIDETKN